MAAVKGKMGKEDVYICNICDKPAESGTVASRGCSCGGRYVKAAVAPLYRKSRGAGEYKSTGITMTKRKTQGYRRSK